MLCLRIGEETYVAILKPEWTICKGKIIWRHMREWRWNNIRNTKHTFVLSCWHGCGELKGDVLQSFWLWQALLCAVLRERQMGTVPVCSLDVLCASILGRTGVWSPVLVVSLYPCTPLLSLLVLHALVCEEQRPLWSCCCCLEEAPLFSCVIDSQGSGPEVWLSCRELSCLISLKHFFSHTV